MIASAPVRVVSLAILAAVIVVGIRGIFSGIALGGDLGGHVLDDGHGGRDTVLSAHGPGSTVKRTRGSVAYVLDGDTGLLHERVTVSVRPPGWRLAS